MDGARTAESPEPAATPATAEPPREKILYAEEVPWPAPRVLGVRAVKLSAVSAVVGAILFTKIPVCPVAVFSGHPCPGCGLTRATLACLQGHFVEAYHLHPLVFLATPIVGSAAALGIYSYLKVGKTRFSPAVMKWLTPPLKGLYVIMVIVWLARFFGAFGGPVEVTHSIFSLGEIVH